MSTPSAQAAINRRERLLDVIRVIVKMRGESQDVPARRHDDPGFVETFGQDPHVHVGDPGGARRKPRPRPPRARLVGSARFQGEEWRAVVLCRNLESLTGSLPRFAVLRFRA